MWASPEVGFSSVVKTFIVVLLPAPFGPRNPNTFPYSTLNEMPSSATFLCAYSFLKLETDIQYFLSTFSLKMLLYVKDWSLYEVILVSPATNMERLFYKTVFSGCIVNCSAC